MASNRGLPAPPSDPGEDWARAIAEMTGDADVTDGAAAGGITAGEATAGEVTAGEVTAGEVTAGDTAIVEPSPELAHGRHQRIMLAAILGLATILVGAFGVWAAVAAHSLRASAADANRGRSAGRGRGEHDLFV